MRERGEIGINQAARMLGVHPNTMRRWAINRVAGKATPVHSVRRDRVGWYWIQRAEVIALRNGGVCLADIKKT